MLPHALEEGPAYAAVADVLLERERFEQPLIGSLEQKGHVVLPQIAKGRPVERQMLAYPVGQRDAKCRGKVVIAGQRFTDAHVGVFAQMPPQLLVRDPGKAIGGVGSSRKEGGQSAEQRDIPGRKDIPRLAFSQAGKEAVTVEQGLPDLLGALLPEEVPVPGLQAAGGHQVQDPGRWGLLQQEGQRLHVGPPQVCAARHTGPGRFFHEGVPAMYHMLSPALLLPGAA